MKLDSKAEENTVEKEENAHTIISFFFIPPYWKIRAYCFTVVHLSVCPSVCLHKLNMKTNIFPSLLN